MPPRSFDSPWKEALDAYLDAFLALFLPDLHALIDWSRGYEVLDTELAEIVREAELGPVNADRLFRVDTLDGQDVWVLIHVEVQAQRDAEFARRMFVYYYRLRDRFGRPVASVAVLADDEANWRPAAFEESFAGCVERYEYRTIKLWDWRDRLAELEALPHPVGSVVAAHLESHLTKDAPEARRDSKWRLIRRLYDRGLTPEEVRKAYRLIDWLLELPAGLEQQLKATVRQHEESQRMPYVTSIERLAREEGRQEGRQEGQQVGERHGLLQAFELGVELKFGSVPVELPAALAGVGDLDRLRSLVDALRSAASADEFLARVRAA